MAKSEKRKIGDLGEGISCNYLKNKGFSIIDRNYWKPWGEIDIIASKKGVIHFVEVKTVTQSLNLPSLKKKKLHTKIQQLFFIDTKNKVTCETKLKERNVTCETKPSKNKVSYETFSNHHKKEPSNEQVQNMPKNNENENVSRENNTYRAEDNLHSQKLKRLSRVIQSYLLSKCKDNMEWQFDVIVIKLDIKDKSAKVEYLDNIIL